MRLKNYTVNMKGFALDANSEVGCGRVLEATITTSTLFPFQGGSNTHLSTTLLKSKLGAILVEDNKPVDGRKEEAGSMRDRILARLDLKLM